MRRLRALLARLDYVFFKVYPGVPVSLSTYLEELRRSGVRVGEIICLGRDPALQTSLLNVYPRARVVIPNRPAMEAEDQSLPFEPLARDQISLVVLNLEAVDFARVCRSSAWTKGADIILVKASLGYFWSGEGDLARVIIGLREEGFALFDLLDYGKPALLRTPLGKVVIAFHNARLTRPRTGKDVRRRRRIAEGSAFLTPPVAQSADLTVLAEAGSFGFAAGVHNPGAIAEGERILLVARGEQKLWGQLRLDRAEFRSGTEAVLIELNAKLVVENSSLLLLAGLENRPESKLEDFRLFRYAGEILCNHSEITPGCGDSAAIRTEALQSRMGLSRVNASERSLTYLGAPTVDRPTRRTEKNWVFFEQAADLYLIYSFSPFHLLRAKRWPLLDFITVFRRDLRVPLGTIGGSIRNSANPVDYDSKHLLHLVHEVYPVKQYVFWAVLIDKETLFPVQISARPLIRGRDSAAASIIYACSIIARRAEVLIFSGLDDAATGVWTIPRTRLDANWTPIEESSNDDEV